MPIPIMMFADRFNHLTHSVLLPAISHKECFSNLMEFKHYFLPLPHFEFPCVEFFYITRMSLKMIKFCMKSKILVTSHTHISKKFHVNVETTSDIYEKYNCE